MFMTCARCCAVAVLAVLFMGAVERDSALVAAVKLNDAAAVRRVLQSKVDVNAPTNDGATALHWAAERGSADIVDLLIRAGAQAEARNVYGVTPLAVASAHGNAAIIERLLTAGANPNQTLAEDETPLMAAARTGRVDALKALLARGADVNAQEKYRGQTALMWAASEGHADAIRALVQSGANVKARSKAGFTPLLFAVRDGQVEAIRTVLSLGADLNDKLDSSDGPTSALALAIINGHYDAASALLELGADPNAADARGTVLHALIWMRRPGLPEGRSNPPPPQSGRVDSLELIKQLLAKGANPNARITWKEIKFDRDDGESKSPPNINIGRDYLSYVGATAFYLAAKAGDPTLMKLLVAHGADPRTPTVQGVTPLMVAAGLGNWEGETPGPMSGVSEVERLEAVKLALDLGNDVNAVADFGNVPLVGGTGLELLWRYPDFDFNNLPDNWLADMRWAGSSAIHGAALAAGQHSIIQLLVDRGARLDARTQLGWTPLMISEGMLVAAQGKSWPETAEFLRRLMRERNMDPAQYSQRGTTPQSAAVSAK